MEIKLKNCIVCKTKFKPFNSLQRVCSNKCAVLFAKEKQAIKQAKNDAAINQAKDENSLKAYIKGTKTIVHKMVRLRDKHKPCISCGATWTNTFQAGHYHKAELFTSLKFDFHNINGQCKKCNIHFEGNLDSYKLNLPKRIGVKEFDSLNKRADLDKHFNKHWTITELKEIRKQAKEIINIYK